MWLAIPPVLLFFFLALNSLVGDSPTMDEQNHLARGLAFLRTADPRLSVEHPPLVNLLSALPLLMLPDLRLPFDHPSWSQPEGWYAFAEQLLWVYNQDVTRMVFLARLPILFLTLALALVAHNFARQIWRSRVAAMLAFFLVLFDPNVMAHGRYTTSDLGGATFLFLAVFLLWRCWQADDWVWFRLLVAAFGLGLAFGSKLSALGFVPILAVMALLPLYDHGGRDGREEHWQASGRRLLQFIVATFLALPVLWLIFAGQWGTLHFQTDLLGRLNGHSGPMPTFWHGVEQVFLLSSHGRMSAFLLGHFSGDGFLAYFPVAFLAKTPLPTLLLLCLAALFLLRTKTTRRRAIFLLVPPILYFLLSLQSALNIGYRHLLPLWPFLFVLISGLAAYRQTPAECEQHGAGRLFEKARPIVLVGLVSALLFTTLLIHPHYLSYFNAAAGGPKNGYQILIDSNVDWGQDLFRLQSWMAENGVEQVKLAWFGTADPAYYQLNYEPLPGLPRHFDLWWNVPFNPEAPEPGIYAISATNLWEIPLREEEKTVFAWFRARQPTDRVGYSILIYDVR